MAKGTAGATPAAGRPSTGTGGTPLRCSLRVFGAMRPGGGPSPVSAGFVQFPAGSIRADPASAVVAAPGTPGLYRTVEQASLPGNHLTATYDPPLRRWVPVRLAQFSADWTHYTYCTEPTPSTHLIHVVDIASGADQVV
jgi:hypothetical protein